MNKAKNFNFILNIARKHKLPIEADKITEVVRRKGVYLLGGKQSEAYSNRSLRQKLYNNIYSNLKYQFGVKSYKSIKRSQCDTVIQLVD